MNALDYLKKKITLRGRLENYDLKEEVGQMVLEARVMKNMTQEELAFLLKTKQSSIARLESGKTLPSLRFLENIAKVMNTFVISPRFAFMDESWHVEKTKLLTKDGGNLIGTTYRNGAPSSYESAPIPSIEVLQKHEQVRSNYIVTTNFRSSQW